MDFPGFEQIVRTVFFIFFRKCILNNFFMMQETKQNKDWMNNTSSRCGKTMGRLLLESGCYIPT